MFGDLFGGVTCEQINQANQAHAVNFMTLMLVLVERGIISTDELETAKARAEHLVEQEWARKREEAVKEFDEKHPGLRQLFGKVLGENVSA